VGEHYLTYCKSRVQGAQSPLAGDPGAEPPGQPPSPAAGSCSRRQPGGISPAGRRKGLIILAGGLGRILAQDKIGGFLGLAGRHDDGARVRFKGLHPVVDIRSAIFQG
jgi:hypothetical protein